MFEIDVWTKAKLVEIQVLSDKDRNPDDNPGVKASFEANVGNDWLSCLGGHLKSTLFEKRGKPAPNTQGTLEGVEPVSDMPNLTVIGQHCGTMSWGQKLEGYTLAIQYGTGRRESNIEHDGCKITGLRFEAIEGGTVHVKWNVEAPNVSEAHFGKLAKLKGCDVDVSCLPPDPEASPQRDVEDGDDKPAGKGSKKREGAAASAGKR